MNKDAAIRVSGLLQAIITSGVPEEQWEAKLISALKLHSKITKKLTESMKS